MSPIKKAHGVRPVNTRSIIVFLGLIGLLQFAAWTHVGFTQRCQPGRPLTRQDVLDLLRVKGKPLSAKNKILIEAVNCRKVDFDLQGYEAALRNAGATKELLSVISRNGPSVTVRQPTPTPSPSPSPSPNPSPSPSPSPTLMNPTPALRPEPLTKEDIIVALNLYGLAGDRSSRMRIMGQILSDVNSRGVDFDIKKKEIADELINAGAADELIDELRKNYRRPAPEIARPTTTTPPNEITTNSGIHMVWIPPGSFMMGSSTMSSDEKPVHIVKIAEGFYMGKYEVTIAEWRAIMKDVPAKLSTFKHEFRDSQNQPVVGVSWTETQRFIDELNKLRDGYTYGLPTEAEWEYACRAQTQGDASSNLDRMAWYDRTSKNRTQEVGLLAANKFGLFDMLGNAYEWCNDAYHENYVGAPTDGSSWFSADTTKQAVLRGGSWRKGVAETGCVVRRKEQSRMTAMVWAFAWWLDRGRNCST